MLVKRCCLIDKSDPDARFPLVACEATTTCTHFCQGLKRENPRVVVATGAVWIQFTELSTQAVRELSRLVASDSHFADFLVTCVAAALTTRCYFNGEQPLYTCLDVAKTTKELLLSLPPEASPPNAHAICIGAIKFDPVQNSHAYQNFYEKIASTSTQLLNDLSGTWTTTALHPLVLYVDDVCAVNQFVCWQYCRAYRAATSKGILRASLNRLQQLGFDVDLNYMTFKRRQTAAPAFFVFTWHDDVAAFHKAARHTIKVMKRSGRTIKGATDWRVDHPSTQTSPATTLGVPR